MHRRLIAVIATILLFQACSTGPNYIYNETMLKLNVEQEHDPNNPEVYYNLGRKYYSNENFPEALKYFNRAIELDYDHPQAHFAVYCASLLADEDLMEAIKYYEVTEEQQARLDSISISFSRAIMFNPIFKWEMAILLTDNIPEFKKFINLDKANWEFFFAILFKFYPDNPQLYYLRAINYAHNMKYSKAIKDIDRLISMAENLNKENILPVYIYTADLHYMKGYFNLSLHRDELARKDFENCLSEDLSYYYAHVHLSNIYQKKGKIDIALEEMDAAIYLQPDDPQLHYNKAVYLSKLRKREEAAESYRECLRLNKHNYRAAYNLAMLLLKLRKKDGALTYFNMYINNAPSSEEEKVKKLQEDIKTWF